MATPAVTPTNPTTRVLQAEKHELAGHDAERVEHAVGVGFHPGLPAQSLGDHDDPNQARQAGENPPSDYLRVNREADGACLGVQIAYGEPPECSGLALETGKIG